MTNAGRSSRVSCTTPASSANTRIGELLLLLFVQPLSRIVATRTSQINWIDGVLHVTFATIPIPMPAPLDALIDEHVDQCGMSLHGSQRTGCLFPGGSPGQHLNTENIRYQLVAIGMKPYAGRKAALFQLAADMPAPVLGELIGVSNNTQPTGLDWPHATGAATSPTERDALGQDVRAARECR